MIIASSRYSIPIVDDENPCYCPSIPAASFLQSLREKVSKDPLVKPIPQALSKNPEDEDYPCPSFAHVLDQSIGEDDLLELMYRRPTLVQQPSPPEECRKQKAS